MNIKNVVITGKLISMKRDDFEEMLNHFGIHMQKSIAYNTDYLITNTPDSGTVKNKRADELGVKKITELDFITMLKEQVASERSINMEENIKSHCKICGKTPDEINEYIKCADEEGVTPEQYVRTDGTYNYATHQFYCTECYIKIGMPLGTA